MVPTAMYSWPDGLSNCTMFPFFVTQYFRNLFPVPDVNVYVQVVVASGLTLPTNCCCRSRAACCVAGSCCRTLWAFAREATVRANSAITCADFFMTFLLFESLCVTVVLHGWEA